MGMITIETRGSFPARRKMFPAMKSGHLVAAQDALDWFTQMVLIPARLQDKASPRRGVGARGRLGGVRQAGKEHGMKRVTYECDGVDCVKTRDADANENPPYTRRTVEVSWTYKHVHLHFCPDCWPSAQAALKLGGDS